MADHPQREAAGLAAGGQPVTSAPVLTPASAANDSEIAALQRLNATAPAPLAARARKARLVGERKPVTAVFADIVGSTALAEVIDPEDWTLIINGAFDEMSRSIFEFEGTIAQIQGDAIISFFGAPVAHEDDPERAVRAALAMTRAIDAYGAQVRRDHGIDFSIRVGISTGLVVVGEVGSDLRFDYTAIGDTMNLASRIQGQAPPGGVLITDRTERFVGPLFELEDLGELELKGKAETVRAFRVMAERAEPGATRGVPGLHSPMVGRAEELESLLRTAETVRAGIGRVAVIIGEPGLGKSRLIAELRAGLRAQDDSTEAPSMAWITAGASSYGRHNSLQLVRSLVLDSLGVHAASSTEEIEAALRGVLARLAPGDDDMYGYLAYSLGLQLTDEAAASIRLISGELLEERVVAAVLRLLRRSVEAGPVALIIDDLHWADPSSVAVLQGAVTLLADVPLLLVLSTRDEPDSPGWDVVRTARDRLGHALLEIRLTPLDHDGSSTLVANLLEIESLPRATRELILGRAEGNPLFVEEVIRMLVEREAIEHRGDRWVATGAAADVDIPDTVHGLILSRIDRLPEEARRVLRVASCIERTFAVSLLEDVLAEAGEEVAVRAALGRLEGAGLLVLESTLTEVEYRFSHALIAEGAYQTMLRQERREWHRRVADVLLRRYPERESELAGQLATHYEQAGDATAATRYLLMAARQVMMRNSMVEAGALLARAATQVEQLPEPESEDARRLRFDVIAGRLAVGFIFMRREESRALVVEGRELAERLGDQGRLASILFYEVNLRRGYGERPETNRELAEAMARLDELASEEGDELQRAMILFQYGVLQWASGEFDASRQALEEAAELMSAHGDRVGASMAMGYYAANLATIGDFAGVDERMATARRLAEDADELARLDYQLAEAAVALSRGDFSRSVEHADRCMSAASEMGALGCATVSGIVLGAAQLFAGDATGAQMTLERSLEYAAQGYMAPQRLRANALLASATAMGGDLAGAQDTFRTVLAELAATRNPYAQAETELMRGFVMATHPDGDPEKGLADLDAARTAFEANGARPYLARAQRARGMALARLGRADEADAALREASTLAAEMDLLDGPWPASVAELQAAREHPPIELVD